MALKEENLRHWSALSRTDPAHTKEFQRAGGFRGTATRPIWNEMRLTEHFGPCGIGWGFDEPKFTLVPAGDELLVYCTLSCWYRDGESAATVWGVGGDKVRVIQRNGPVNDDEAYKKAFTDALGNAFKHIGVNADIHMGLFEDSKYKDETRAFYDKEQVADTPVQAEMRGQPSAQKPVPATHVAPDAGVNRGTSDADKKIAKASYDRLRAALREAKLPTVVDTIIAAGRDELAFVKKINPDAYDQVMALSVARKNELLASA